MRRALCLIVISIIGFALMSGCASKDKSNNNQVALHSGDKTNSHDAFETSNDPPINANTRFAAAQLAESQGQADRAIEQYQAALKADPNHRDASFRLAALLMQQRKFPEAIPAWQHYVEVTKQAPEAYNDLALCYEAAGQMDKAEETYKSVIARDPLHSPCRVNYGLMLARHDRTADAVAQLSTALKPAEVSYNLGRVCEEQGKPEVARAWYLDALKKDPNMHDAKSKLETMK